MILTSQKYGLAVTPHANSPLILHVLNNDKTVAELLAFYKYMDEFPRMRGKVKLPVRLWLRGPE